MRRREEGTEPRSWPSFERSERGLSAPLAARNVVRGRGGSLANLDALAFLGWLSLRYRVRMPLVHIPFYFVLANVAAFWGFLLYLKGERKVTWTTVR